MATRTAAEPGLRASFSATRLLLLLPRPFGPHLRDAVHEDARLLAFLLAVERLQELDRMREIVFDGLFGRLEVDAPDLFDRRLRITCRSGLQRFQRDESVGRFGHYTVR